MKRISRRDFVKTLAASTAALGFPTIIPSRVLGANAPSNTIQIGQIGFGRIATMMDVPGILSCSGVRIVAISDLDKNRMTQGRQFIQKKFPNLSTPDIRLFQDYREMIIRTDIDAVAISTPDHWHSQPAVEAAFAGKDIYMQKPASLTIEEGQYVCKAVRENQRVFLLGSQQRSSPQFHRACELVRNERIGRVKSIEIGLPGDPGGGRALEMPVPSNLNYEMWLGSTPMAYYTEDRVHPQKNLGRPGWLRCEQFGAGMITGWGSHHVDIAHWAMGWEATGPVLIEGRGVFHTGGLWDVHGDYDVTLTYADGVPVRIWNKFPNGVRFIGEKGWIFVSRGSAKATASDPGSGQAQKELDASDPKIVTEVIGPNEIHLYKHNGSHHQNWIDCIRSRKETIVPVETAHRSCSSCLLAHISMRLGGKLQWDPAHERFINDDEANKWIGRTERAPYGTRRAYEKLSSKPV